MHERNGNSTPPNTQVPHGGDSPGNQFQWVMQEQNRISQEIGYVSSSMEEIKRSIIDIQADLKESRKETSKEIRELDKSFTKAKYALIGGTTAIAAVAGVVAFMLSDKFNKLTELISILSKSQAG